MSRVHRVVSATPRLRERARRERRSRWGAAARRTAWGAAVVAPFAIAAWLLLASPWLVVDRVLVHGEERLSSAEVLAAARVERGTPLARVDTDGVAARVRALGPVATVTVSRSWPRTLRVTLVERVPVVAVPQAPAFVLLDADGVVVAREARVPRGAVRLLVARPGPDDAATRSALSVLEGLPKALRGLVAVVRAPSPEQVTLELRDKRVVLWGGPTRAGEKAAALAPLLKMKGRVFDVSSPDVVTRR